MTPLVELDFTSEIEAMRAAAEAKRLADEEAHPLGRVFGGKFRRGWCIVTLGQTGQGL